MANFDANFEHLTQYRIIRCKSCRYAVVPEQVERHMKDHHPQVVPARRREISRAAMSLSNVAHRHEDVVYPNRDDEPVPGFPIITDALVCNGRKEGEPCEYTCTAIRTMQQHCKDVHGWHNDQGRGGNTRAKSKHASNRVWEHGIWCQRFFEYKQWKRVFPVARGRVEEQTDGGKCSAATASKLVQRAQDIVDEAEKREDSTRDHFVADP
jgi:hypothetical protein